MLALRYDVLYNVRPTDVVGVGTSFLKIATDLGMQLSSEYPMKIVDWIEIRNGS
jgi:hypothetical protein